MLRVDGDRLPFAAPWLIADPTEGSVQRNRGVADGLGLRLLHSDRAIHLDNEPDGEFARVVFDILEQLRCESLADPQSLGMAANLDAAFLEWTDKAESHQVGDSVLGLLLYTLTHMARAGLVRPIMHEAVDQSTEVTRSNISPIIGAPLYQLRAHKHDQAIFALHARHVAALMNDLAGNPDQDKRSSSTVAQRTGLTIPAGFESSMNGEGELHSVGSAFTGQSDDDRVELEDLGGYRIFTTEHDQVVEGRQLYPADERLRLRAALDRQIGAQAVSVNQLALRLQRLLGRPVEDGWVPLQEDGILDPARLSGIVVNTSHTHAFRQPWMQPTSPAVVTFVVDQSGSMKRQRYETVAVLLDTFCRALDLAGAKSEILGFTTGDWNGGRPLKEFYKAGSPKDPGRLNELLHIVYKSADQPWRRARTSIASMTQSRHFREGVDGEALAWAYRRLQQRSEPRRLLVFVSDGSPFDAASANNNRVGFMDDHIAAVARRIERDPAIEFGAVSLDLDMTPYTPNAVQLDLSGTLTLAHYRVLETLFANPAHNA